MSDDLNISSRPTRDSRPDITMPDGSVRTPRARLAKQVHLSERTIARLNTPTTYVGGCAYVDPAITLLDIAGKLQRRNAPPNKRRS